jgi:hypothetical protein
MLSDTDACATVLMDVASAVAMSIFLIAGTCDFYPDFVFQAAYFFARSAEQVL